MCKPCMFSYPLEVLQTRVAERAENHFNGIVASSSGKRDLRARQTCLMDCLRRIVAAAYFCNTSGKKKEQALSPALLQNPILRSRPGPARPHKSNTTKSRPSTCR